MIRRPRAVISTLLAAAALLAAGALWSEGAAPAAAQDAPDDEFAWRTDLEAAREDARESGRPLLIVFR